MVLGQPVLPYNQAGLNALENFCPHSTQTSPKVHFQHVNCQIPKALVIMGSVAHF